MTTLTPTSSAHETPAKAAPAPLYGVMAEFVTPEAITKAAIAVHAAGYRFWDCHVPFPVHGLDKAMGVKRTILPFLVFGAGLTGMILAFCLQAFTNAASFSLWALVWVSGYPFLISGKPMMSIPAWIPVIFEFTVLLSALAAAGLMLGLNHLPRLSHPLLSNNRFRRATDDRFFVVIEARDPKFLRSKTEAFLASLGATHVEAVEDR
ncbi:MAG: DUF3341 domain-containing protein [Phycisphaerales bacterium]|nr:DUF3341 domain-containing protein [Phycisphaerales bacterium]